MGRRRGHLPHFRTVIRAVVGALVVAVLVPAVALAHPLGNFTINHYAGVRIEPDRILLDVVIDQAEIPAFQARLGLDLDRDGLVSDDEIAAGRRSVCDDLRSDLDLRVEGVPTALSLVEARLAFPPGAGGLSTMREVCGYRADLATAVAAGATVTFADRSFAERIGWREIVVVGSRVSVAEADGGAPPSTSVSGRLTRYPPELLTRPLAISSLVVTVTGAGPTLPPFDIPDAESIDEAPAAPDAARGPEPVAAAAVPGGVGSADLPAIFRSTDLTPLVLFVSLLTAAALGAGHALTPGHGKTLMAAYLVGTKGRPLHALGLGLSVSVSHTVGILVLAALVVGAQGVLAPDAIVRGAPVAAAISIVVIGGWMLVTEARKRRAAAKAAADVHAHDHPHEHAHEHSHGGVTHSHVPRTGSTITWRSLFVLGLAGGLIPSTSALLILLGSIAAGRPAFGFALVVAFGFGMAAVMAGIGLAMVYARSHFDRIGSGTSFGRVTASVPLVTAVLVFGLGLYLTAQAVGGTPTL
jgi:ABC-type nickel/cobalt efflux system permease component RcnA